MNKINKKQFLSGLLFVLCSVNILFAQELISFPQEITPLKGDFYIKPVHSFGFQYNACIVPKAKFTNQNPNPIMGYDPLISYGNEFIIKYNYASALGLGFTVEAMQGTTNYRYRSKNAHPSEPTIFTHDVLNLLIIPFFYNYMGFNVKLSYIKRLTPFLYVQPELGLKLVYYPDNEFIYDRVNYVDTTIVSLSYMEYDNLRDGCQRQFFPDLTMNINFLFHTKRNPRNNFLIGVNANLGFVPRYKGYYTITPPYTEQQKDCDIRIGSTYFGLNFGYEFTGVKKPLYRTRNYRKEQPFLTFDFSKPIHSFGIAVSAGTSFSARMIGKTGEISPHSQGTIVPEIFLKYSLSLSKGWGLSVELPFGLFYRYSSYSLFGHIPEDSLWSRGAVGAGQPLYRNVRVPYLGFVIKASYLAQIHRNMFIQPEAGLKFMPFLRPASYWEMDEVDWEVPYVDTTGNRTDIIWLYDVSTIPVGYYAVPDLTLAVNFIVHGKTPHNNFIFGVNANICFVDRVRFHYSTTNELPAHLQSSGKYSWRTTAIAFYVGYQFMKGETKETRYKNRKMTL
jgi:hypothetical protein